MNNDTEEDYMSCGSYSSDDDEEEEKAKNVTDVSPLTGFPAHPQKTATAAAATTAGVTESGDDDQEGGTATATDDNDVESDDATDDDEYYDNFSNEMFPALNSEEAKSRLERLSKERPKLATGCGTFVDGKTGKVLKMAEKLEFEDMQLGFIWASRCGQTTMEDIDRSMKNASAGDANLYRCYLEYKSNIFIIMLLHEKLKLNQFSIKITSNLNSGVYCLTIAKKCAQIISKVKRLLVNHPSDMVRTVCLEALNIYWLTISDLGRVRTPDNQLNFCPIVAALSHKLYISNDHDNIKKCLNTELIQFISGLRNAWYSRVVQKLNELSLFVGITAKEENLSNDEKCLLETVTNTLFVNPRSLENRPNNFVVATIVFLRQTEATRGVVYGGKKRQLSESEKCVTEEEEEEAATTSAAAATETVATTTVGAEEPGQSLLSPPTKRIKMTDSSLEVSPQSNTLSLEHRGLGRRRADITTRILGPGLLKRSINRKTNGAASMRRRQQQQQQQQQKPSQQPNHQQRRQKQHIPLSPPPTEGASKTIKIMVVFIKEYLEYVGVTDKTLQISKEVTLNKPTYSSNLDNKTSSLALLAFHDVLREFFDVVGG